MEVTKNEVQVLQSIWQRHYDIINHQISYILDDLTGFGIDPRSLPFFQDDFNESLESFHDKAARLEADKEVAVRKTQPAILDKGEDVSDDESDESITDDGTLDVEADEDDKDDILALMEEKAEKDDLVQMYATDKNEDISKSAYPSAFEKTIPVAVLKALAYAT